MNEIEDQFLTEEEHDMFKTGTHTLRFIVENSVHKKEMATLLLIVASALLQSIENIGRLHSTDPIEVLFDPTGSLEKNVQILLQHLNEQEVILDGREFLP